MNKHETRPTPETDEEERIDNGDTHPLLEFARKLERERDELREALAVIQAREADLVLAKDRTSKRAESLYREVIDMLEVIRWAHDALKELRSFYIETTGLPPCAANAAIAKLKTFLP